MLRILVTREEGMKSLEGARPRRVGKGTSMICSGGVAREIDVAMEGR